MALTDVKVQNSQANLSNKLTDGNGMHLLVHPTVPNTGVSIPIWRKEKMLAWVFILMSRWLMQEHAGMKLVSC
jgi:hypothetical protein